MNTTAWLKRLTMLPADRNSEVFDLEDDDDHDQAR